MPLAAHRESAEIRSYMREESERLKSNLEPPERAYLVGVEWKLTPQGGYAPHAWSATDSLDELAQLALTAGMEVIGQTIQRLDKPRVDTFIGRGKAEEIAETLRMLEADVVIFDDELSPRHQRELERIFGPTVKVIDRTILILDIFAQHAHTREGALQVELAQYEYRLPRLTQVWTQRALTRQAGGRAGGSTGGVGLRGPGETKLEMDRRLIRARIAQLKQELEQVREHRARYRSQRRRSGLPTVALVGYTNAGKSTLLNRLSGAEVYIADQLFATLDPTTRRVQLPGGTLVLVTDTVGFIQKLPAQLVAAFRATLEEVSEADLLLHVIDVSHPLATLQARAVYETLELIGAAELPIINVFNKIDLLPDPAQAQSVLQGLPDSVAISAQQGLGIEALLKHIEDVLESEMVRVRLLIPFQRGDLVNLFHERGLVEAESYTDKGTLLTGRLPRPWLTPFAPYRLAEGKKI